MATTMKLDILTNAPLPADLLPSELPIVYVHLADNEYSSHQGGRIMENVAKEMFRYFTTELGYPRLEVEVVEHGGWHLRYALDKDGEPMIIGSANDGAHWDDQTQSGRWRKNYYHYRRRLIADIRREKS